MKQITLNTLTLRDFKGFTFTFQPGCEDASVFGANASGKTTLSDAWHWLLFDKDSSNRSEFEIKPLRADGEQEHNIESSVEAELSVDGNPIILKKTYKEVYSRKRGSAEQSFTGHTSEYAVNGVPTKMSDYKNQIAEMLGDEFTFRLLTSPTVFPSLPWQKARTILLDCAGDVTDAQVIECDSSLAPLTELLTKYTVSKTPLEDLKKVTVSRKSELNKQIDQIPVRIDEARRGLPDITGLHRPAVEAEVQALETKLNDTKLRLQGIDTGGRIAALTKELNTIDSELSALQNKHYLANMDKVTKLNQQIRELTESDEARERKAKSIKAELEEKKERIATLDKNLTILREKWAGFNAEEFQDVTVSICPACGQNLPEERVEEAREKARADFNAKKAERLTEIQVKGKQLAAEKERIVKEIEQLSGQAADYSRNPEIDRLTDERNAARDYAEDYRHIEGRQELFDRRAVAERAVQLAKDSVAEDVTAISEEVESIAAMLKEAKEKADRFVRRETGEKRIEELKAEEKKYAREFGELEKTIFMIETFIKRKVSMLNDRINSKFELVRFKLFNVLVNGGIEECCVFMVKGVPFDGGLNSAARTQGGMDIIRTLQRHYGIAPVVWVDNRESCTEIPEMPGQVISLYVSPEDKVLRVEKVQQERPRRAAGGGLFS